MRDSEKIRRTYLEKKYHKSLHGNILYNCMKESGITDPDDIHYLFLETVVLRAPIIYLVTNKINGKQYIGRTNQPLMRRIRGHINGSRKALREGKESYLLGAAIIKYGFDNFEYKQIEQCFNDSDANNAEKRLIQELGTLSPAGYNLRLGGTGGKWSEDARKNITGKIRTEAHRKNLSNSLKGRAAPPGTLHSLEIARAGALELRQKGLYINKRNSIFTDNEVREIRRLYATGNWFQREIADLYGAKQSAIGHIVTRRTYPNVKD